MDTQVFEVKAPKREFILFNPSYDKVEVAYGGLSKWLPPANEVIPATGRIHDFHSGVDADGDYIPGTLVLEDIQETDPITEAQTTNWDAWQAIKAILGVDLKTGVANGPYALRGITWIPNGSTKEKIKELRAQARLRSQHFKVAEARRYLNDFEKDNVLRKGRGFEPMSGDAKYAEAIRITSIANERDQKRAEAIFEEEDNYGQTLDTSKPVPVLVESVKDTGFMAAVEEAVEEKAAKLSVEEKHAIVDALTKDEELMKILRSRYKMVKYRELEKKSKDE